MNGMTVAQYNEGWQTLWDDMKRFGPFSRHLRRLLLELMRPLTFTSVLDVGCGQGSLLEDVVRERPGTLLNGTDFSSAAVELARRRVPNGRFWVLDITREVIPEQFDLVICSEVLEHIVDDVRALTNLLRMTRGYLLISTVQGRMRRFEASQMGHVRNYGTGELVRKVEDAGFEVVRKVEWGFPFYSPLYRNFLAATGGQGTTGRFGLPRRLIAATLYWVFMLNSSNSGDEILILARPRDTAAMKMTGRTA